jgi:energy-coupling factor transport system permease protein
MTTIGLNPLAKLWLGCTAVAAVWVSRSLSTLCVEAGVVAVLLVWTQGQKRAGIRTIGPMAAAAAVVGVIFFDPATALLLALRVFNLLGVCLFAFSRIRPEEIGAALTQLRLPSGLVFMLTASLRYVPLMHRRIRSIRDAQQARGIDLRWRLKNAGNWMAFLAPLLVQSFLLADDLALALESRGFSRKNRSVRRRTRLTPRDGALMAAAVLALAVLACWEIG